MLSPRARPFPASLGLGAVLVALLLAGVARPADAGPRSGAARPSTADQSKARAARHALRQVKPGMVIGMGGGSTVEIAVKLLGRRYRAGKVPGLKVVPASPRTEAALQAEGIPVTTLAEHPTLALSLDGADEVSGGLDLIKGGGGMLTGEHMLAEAARRNVIIVDSSKLSRRLGTRWALPIEVLKANWDTHASYLAGLGAKTVERRMNADGTPFVTEHGNYILMVDFGQIRRPAQLKRALQRRTGIVSDGLFLGVADEVVVAKPQGIEVRRRGGPRPSRATSK